jgi:hypothetical protein
MSNNVYRYAALIKSGLRKARYTAYKLCVVLGAFLLCALPGPLLDCFFIQRGSFGPVPSIPSFAVSFCMGFFFFHRVLHWVLK